MSGHAYTARALPQRPVAGRSGRPGPAPALLLAGLCVAALVCTWVLAELLPAGQVRDSLALHHFELLSRPHVDSLANAMLHLLDPLVFICWGVALVTVALVRRRPRVALAVALVLALAPLSAEVLKPLLAHPHLQIAGTTYISAASWPSGHSAAALALVLCAVLVAPARLRPLVAALGGAFAVAVGCSLLILAWHMPSDVVGGYLVAVLWTALAVAGLRAADRRWPSTRADRSSGGSRASVGSVRARVPQ
jgi:membrane-associated phospholipid phosphatase